MYDVLAAQRYQLWAVAYFGDCSADKLVPRFGPTTALKPRSPKSRAIGTRRFLTIVPTELDRVALAHSTFSEDALCLIVRSSEGILRAARNLCVGALLEAVRDRTKTIGLKQVNRVLMQPHWRHEREVE